MVSYDQKGHITLCFTCNFRITWPEESCHTLFQLSPPNGQNVAIDNAISITQHQCWHQPYHMSEKVMLYLILIIVA